MALELELLDEDDPKLELLGMFEPIELLELGLSPSSAKPRTFGVFDAEVETDVVDDDDVLRGESAMWAPCEGFRWPTRFHAESERPAIYVELGARSA